MARLRLALLGIVVGLLACACGPSGHASPAPAPERAREADTRAPARAAGAAKALQVPAAWQSRIPVIGAGDIPATLRQADAALAAGRLEQGAGPGPGALELYLAVLDIAPADAAAARGIRASLESLLERGRLAMRRGDVATAARIDGIASAVLPAHADLAVYRSYLAAARRAAAEVARADAAGRRGRMLQSSDSVSSHLALAEQAVPDFEPASLARATWNGRLLADAWAAAGREDFAAADRLLLQSQALSPGNVALRVMGLRVVERRQARTDAILAEGNAAVDALTLARADQALAHAARIAAQPARVDALRERIHLARHYGPFKPRQVFSDRLGIGGVGPEMVVVPYGAFEMGAVDGDTQADASESPAHRVEFSHGFAIGRSEVTVGEFGRFVQATGYLSDATRAGHSSVYDERGGVFTEHEGVDWRRDHVGRIASPSLPVVHVTVDDARAYAQWLSDQAHARYRLPSEAEFEYVLRAGTRTIYPWGDGPPRRVVGNLPGDGDLSRSSRRWGNAIPGYRDAFWGPAPVRNFPPERMGTYDMTGNVAEWTLDCWHESYQRAPVDGSAWVNPGCPQRVVRGASWDSSLDQARSASRLAVDANTSSARLGFRVVREI
jgi:formylglycine-generating enzyme required for sulfatase activity